MQMFGMVIGKIWRHIFKIWQGRTIAESHQYKEL